MKCKKSNHNCKNYRSDDKSKNKKNSNQLNNDGNITSNVNYGYPNNIGIYNITRNVSELTASKGIAKGSSWTNKDVHIEKDLKYDKPSSSIGFRCVCEIVK